MALPPASSPAWVALDLAALQPINCDMAEQGHRQLHSEHVLCLQVDLPKDPALEDFKHVKPAFGISPPVSETGSPHSPSGTPHACPLRDYWAVFGGLGSLCSLGCAVVCPAGPSGGEARRVVSWCDAWCA